MLIVLIKTWAQSGVEGGGAEIRVGGGRGRVKVGDYFFLSRKEVRRRNTVQRGRS